MNRFLIFLLTIVSISNSCNPLFIIQRTDNLIKNGNFDQVFPDWETEPFPANLTCNRYDETCNDLSKDHLPGPLVGDNYIMFSSPSDTSFKTATISQEVNIPEDIFDKLLSLDLTLYFNIHSSDFRGELGTYVSWNNKDKQLLDQTYQTFDEYVPFTIHLDKPNTKYNILKIHFYCGNTPIIFGFPKMGVVAVGIDNITLTGDMLVPVEVKIEKEETTVINNIYINNEKPNTENYTVYIEVLFELIVPILEVLDAILSPFFC